MADASPDAGRVTPNLKVGEKAREGHPVVFVLDVHGTPLQPTSPARARRLLKRGRTVVARHTPFVIRLKDRTVAESQVDGVELGIDPGSKCTGIAVFTAKDGERRGVYAVELAHRGAVIRDKLTARASYRRGRRSRNLRHRAPRFSNRTRPQGRLAPSLRHRVETTMSWASRLARWAPVRAVHVERVAFDTHAMSNGGPLQGAEYQHGTLHGTEVREYLLAKWGRACAYCGIIGNRQRTGIPETHTLDALCVGELDIITRAPACVLAVTATGRGAYTRTRTDKYGFPRLRLPRQKQFFGYQTGDLARAVVPSGKETGTHTGRIAVRATGSFNIKTVRGLVQGIGHKYFRLLQRADGYAYVTRPEGPTER
ncbi:RNA-guided endonuclease IscB [Streptomyces sp. NPDC002467]|uniref:RNA-guided endonuclease IscB n=1 Tax=Streptomyces sp. NPDC002467 TaxID=3364647 RepID=UPI0036AF4B22